MGCPYDAKLVYGIKLTSAEAKSLDKKFDKLAETVDDWEKEVGEFESCTFSDEDGKKHYLELVDIESVSNCDFMSLISESALSNAAKEANKIYNGSPFLKKEFSIDQVQLLLICNYCG
jgi:hypothetical protein